MFLIYAALAVLIGCAAYLGGKRVQRQRERRLWVGVCRDLAHQLGTPLSALMGWMEILPTTKEPESAFREMNRDLERLKIVTERLNRVGSPSKFESVPLRGLIAEVRAYYLKRLPAGDAGIQINEEISGNPTVHGIRVLLAWALEILVKMAIDAVSPEGGTIALRANVEGAHVILDVSDTGRGIEREGRRKILQPGPATRRSGRGAGFSLVKYIMEEIHGGRLAREASSAGQGTILRITLKAETDH